MGYASAKIASSSTGAVVIDFGGKFGRTFKQSIGTRIVFSGENDDWSDGTGNVGEVYYTLGYKIVKNTSLSTKIGYGFENFGSTRNETIYLTGFVYGVTAKYTLSDSLDLVATYTHGDLKFESIKHSYDVADIGIALVF